nr:MAG TPA: hypothetical protein [Caudoviricetes sp.]
MVLSPNFNKLLLFGSTPNTAVNLKMVAERLDLA